MIFRRAVETCGGVEVAGAISTPKIIKHIGSAPSYEGLFCRSYNALRSSGTSPNFLMTLASLKSPVAGSPVRLKATAPT